MLISTPSTSCRFYCIPTRFYLALILHSLFHIKSIRIEIKHFLFIPSFRS